MNKHMMITKCIANRGFFIFFLVSYFYQCIHNSIFYFLPHGDDKRTPKVRSLNHILHIGRLKLQKLDIIFS